MKNKKVLVKIPSVYSIFDAGGFIGDETRLNVTIKNELSVDFEELKSFLRENILERINEVFVEHGFLKSEIRKFCFDIYKDSLDFIFENWTIPFNKEALKENQRAFLISAAQSCFLSGLTLNGFKKSYRRAKTYYRAFVFYNAFKIDDKARKMCLKPGSLWWGDGGPAERVVSCSQSLAEYTLLYVKESFKFSDIELRIFDPVLNWSDVRDLYDELKNI